MSDLKVGDRVEVFYETQVPISREESELQEVSEFGTVVADEDGELQVRLDRGALAATVLPEEYKVNRVKP